MAITLAPQAVMFVGLTHATIGLDHVRPGGRDDPERARPPFRTLTMPVIIGFGIGFILLVAGIAGLIRF